MPEHEAYILRSSTQPDSYRMACSCGLMIESDWVEIITELTAHLGGKLPGYAVPHDGRL